MSTQRERDRMDSDDMKGTQSDSSRSHNRQAAANADQFNDPHSNEGGESDHADETIGTHQEGQYSRQTDKPEVERGPIE